tara:strand:+ start:745 stop:1017 length:273 start_codon:yes stop_codon:yes gene_type:complete
MINSNFYKLIFLHITTYRAYNNAIRRYIIMSTTDEIKTQMETYLAENEKFSEKGIKASATRARKALQELGKLVKARRKEILEEKASASSN